MPEYRRAFSPGGTFFFTVVTHERRRLFDGERNRRLLREAIETVRAESPFGIDAFVLLPDHIHSVWTLPDGDSDFSSRWARLKLAFTRSFLSSGGRDAPVSASKRGRHRRGIWQPRFWEHRIRDAQDYNNHLDYVHYNPVKHGLAACPHLWPHSSFHRHVALLNYPGDWMCCCHDRFIEPPSFAMLPESDME